MGSSSAMRSFFLLWIVIGIVIVTATILFPIWAARYASTRGRSDLALITIASILFGLGFFVGLVAWLALRNTPVISISRSIPSSDSSGSDSSDDSAPYRDPNDIPAWVERLDRIREAIEEKERDEEERKAREADDY